MDWYFDPVSTLLGVAGMLERYRLMTTLDNLAWALLAALFAYGVARALWFSRSGDLGVLAGRTLLVMALLSPLMVDGVRALSLTTWLAIYEQSSAVWGASGDDVMADLRSISAEMRTTLPSYLGVAAVTASTATGQYQALSEGLEAGDGAAPSLLDSAVTWLMGLVASVLLPVLSMIYTVFIFLSGMIVLFGVALYPLGPAMLMAPGGVASSWASSWLRMMAGAFFFVLLLPLVTTIVVNVALIQPLAGANVQMQEAVTTFNAASASMDAAMVDMRAALLLEDLSPKAHAEAALRNLQASFSSFASGLWRTMMGLLTAVVGALVGVLGALFLLLRSERYVTGFIGGVVGSAGMNALVTRAARSARGRQR